MIAATTDKEYIEYISHNDALARRFKQIPVQPLSKEQTITLLSKMVLQNPGMQVTDETIEYVFENTLKFFPERPQPYMASRILAQAISKVKDSQFSELEIKISREEAALNKILFSQLLNNDTALLSVNSAHMDIQDEIVRLRKNIEALKQQLKEEKLNTENLKHLLINLENSKKEVFMLSEKLSNVSSKHHPKLNSMLKEFALLNFYVNKAWDAALQSHAAPKDSRFLHINNELIDQIINRELALWKEKEKMLSEKRT